MTAVSEMRIGDEAALQIEARLGAVRAALDSESVPSLLVTGEQDVRFLAGCFGHDTRVLVTDSRAILISDRRYEEYLAPWAECGLFEVAIFNRPGQLQHVASVLGDEKIGVLGIQAAHLTLDAKAGLAASLDGIELAPVHGLMATLRMRKSPEEVEAIRRAIAVQSAALETTLSELRVGMTEGQVAARLIYEMRIRGAEGEAFEPIVASGPNASVIHHVPGAHPIGPGVLLIDWGARIDGLCSDLTRTFFLGEPDDEMRRIYSVVAEAERAAIDACQVGTATAEVDAAAREIIAAAGWGDHFAHSVGHGLGRDVHERPFLGREGEQTKLAPGMVVTIEPGIYIPGRGGVRIEDDILVTEDGPCVLSAALDSSLEGAIRPIPDGGHTR
ncbi:MAG: aminopeptidase P family protein [Planctomycetes bacterium]|jgi:Xaa-Pro aminopeptidase|nr:aminopeptidase P family protein [Planctomycetota bacterium]